jgi:hypothetical protein
VGDQIEEPDREPDRDHTREEVGDDDDRQQVVAHEPLPEQIREGQPGRQHGAQGRGRSQEPG